jgi:hypothetical protein
MNTFPQLTSGAVAQFPFRKESAYRTLINSGSGANEIISSDADFQMRVWEWPLGQLTDGEWQGIEDLFQMSEGRLGTFLFLEPGQNLLSWSERLADPIWQKGSGISVTDEQPDPMGGMGAVRVTSSGGGATVSQVLPIPASYRYVASVWARTGSSGGPLRVTDTASGSVEIGFRTDNSWRRYSIGYSVSSASASVAFELVAPSGAPVEIFGPQLEAQIAPSTYKRTVQQAGVFAGARFDSDVLSDTATGVDRHSGVIRIVWTPSLT